MSRARIEGRSSAKVVSASESVDLSFFCQHSRDELDEPAVPGRLQPASGVHAAPAYGLHAPDPADADAGASLEFPPRHHLSARSLAHSLAPREQAQRTGFQPQMSMQVSQHPIPVIQTRVTVQTAARWD